MNNYGLRIRDNYKIIPIKLEENEYELFSFIVVETNRGEECGQIVLVPDSLFRTKRDIRVVKILRKASEDDKRKLELLEGEENKYFKTANTVLYELGNYAIKIVHCESLFNQDKVIFYYREEEEDSKKKHKKINIREIIEEMTKRIGKPVELREVGDRGAAKIMGGLGPCGRVFCCTSWLGKTKTITVKMAKEQSMTINIPKLSGGCNRLKCCLKYELENYSEGKLKD